MMYTMMIVLGPATVISVATSLSEIPTSEVISDIPCPRATGTVTNSVIPPITGLLLLLAGDGDVYPGPQNSTEEIAFARVID